MKNRFVQSCATVAVVVIFAYLLLSLDFTRNHRGIKDDERTRQTLSYPESISEEDDTEIQTLQDLEQQFGTKNDIEIKKRPKIWISMSLCFDETTEKYGKAHYPYSEVTPLALMLWNYFYPDTSKVSVLLFLVHKYEKKTPHMETYEKVLAQTGVHVEWVLSDGMDCVLMAQLVRLFAFGHPLVKPNDIVMTVDINLFLMTGDILDPIYENPDKLAWLYQYDETAIIETGVGESFNQNLMSMPAKVWRSILEAPSKLNSEWLQDRIEKVNLDRNETWYYDQWISTFALLRNRICSAPKFSGLWNHKDLVYDPDFDDSATCWHGKYYKDCNKEVAIVGDKCKWWHFYPSENFEAHVKKFNEITNNQYKLKMSSILDAKR